MPLKRLIALALIVTLPSAAQSCASASASATIVSPIHLQKSTDLALTMQTSALQKQVSFSAPSAFLLSSTEGYAYTIPLPPAALLSCGRRSIVACRFAARPERKLYLDSIALSALLHIDAALPAGHYTAAANFDVVINYQ